MATFSLKDVWKPGEKIPVEEATKRMAVPLYGCTDIEDLKNIQLNFRASVIPGRDTFDQFDAKNPPTIGLISDSPRAIVAPVERVELHKFRELSDAQLCVAGIDPFLNGSKEFYMKQLKIAPNDLVSYAIFNPSKYEIVAFDDDGKADVLITNPQFKPRFN